MRQSIFTISIFLILIVASIAIVSLTNIDDLISSRYNDAIKQVQVEIPFQTYDINTECKLLYFVKTGPSDFSLFSILSDLEKFEKTYPDEFNQIQKLADEQKYDNNIPSSDLNEIVASIVIKEYSINPKLKPTLVYMLDNGFTYNLAYSINQTEPDCAQKTIEFEKARVQKDLHDDLLDSGKSEEHVHASILTKLENYPSDIFSNTAYQLKNGLIHFEADDGYTIHRHAKDVTLGFLFETLGIDLTDECLIIVNGRYCTNDDDSLKFFINHQQISDIRNYVIQDEDRILISHGNQSQKEIERQLAELNSQVILD